MTVPDDGHKKREQERRRQTCESLELEFEAIHGRQETPFARNGTLQEREAALIAAWHAVPGGQSALCLSGGGIRSATFALGVLQALAQARLLFDFHYLSTVSGGGYIGNWLTAWRRRAGNDHAVCAALAGSVGQPAGAAPRSAGEPAPIRRLRAYSNYLSPAVGLGGDLFALLGNYARNLCLHWSAIIPILLAVVLVPRLYLALLRLHAGHSIVDIAIGAASICVAFAFAYVAADLPQGVEEDQPHDRFSWFCLLPLAVAALLLGWVGAQLTQPAAGIWYGKHVSADQTDWIAAVVVGAVVGFMVYATAFDAGLIWRDFRRSGPVPATQGLLNRALAAVFGSALGGALLGASLWGVSGCRCMVLSASWYQWYAVLAPPALFGLLWLSVALYVGVASRWDIEAAREWWARAGGYWLIVAIAWMSLGTVVILLPGWILAIQAIQAAPGSATFGAATLLGLISAGWGFWSRHGATLRTQAKGLAERFGARVLDLLALAFIVALGVMLALLTSLALERLGGKELSPLVSGSAAEMEGHSLSEAGCPLEQRLGDRLVCVWASPQRLGEFSLSDQYRATQLYATPRVLSIWVIGLLVFGALMWWFTGPNTFSLHGLYCNRLVRAYLGASADEGPSSGRRPHGFTGFDPKDNLPLAHREQGNARLFPVINAALNLVKPAGGRLEWQQRKAASFMFTPLNWGSPVLAFEQTQPYDPAAAVAHDDAAVSLGRAMAISGAAASPNMGYHTSTLVAFVLFFFNVRLGWWTRNPAIARGALRTGRDRLGRLRLMAAEAFGRTSEDSTYVYLSDGGHFENLGLYEMVRRRCHRIVVVDAAHDPGYAYEDLANCIRKVRVDFGIEIRFDRGLPTPESCRRNRLPYAIGSIDYRAVDGSRARNGRIVYLKPVLCGDEPQDLLDYAARSRRGSIHFPQQPTSDQFFDEAQFESYRILGLLTAQKAFGDGPWPVTSPRHAPADRAEPDGRRMPPTPWSAQQSDGGGSGPSPKTLADLGETFRSMGEATKAALIVAGTTAVAVPGTLALRSAELSLSADSIRALQGIVVRHELPQPDRDAIVGQVKGLSEAVADLAITLNPQRASSKPTAVPAQSAQALASATSARASKQAVGLQQAIEDLASAVRTGGVLPPTSDLQALVDRLKTLTERLVNDLRDLQTQTGMALELRKASEDLAMAARGLSVAIARIPWPPARPASVPVEVTLKPDSVLEEYLKQMQEALGRIEGHLQGVPPRRNVRSSTEGGRQ